MSAEVEDVEIVDRPSEALGGFCAVIRMSDGKSEGSFFTRAEAEEYIREERPDLRLYKEPSE